MTYMYFVTLQIIKRQSVSGKYNVSVKLTYIILFVIEQTQLFKINVNKTLSFPVEIIIIPYKRLTTASTVLL